MSTRISPNLITEARLVSVGILFILMLILNESRDGEGMNKALSFTSAILFTVSMASDMLDGYLARKHGLVSAFGTFIDPLADKLLFLVAMIMLIELGRLPAWVVVLFMTREILVTALRSVAAEKGIIISASHWGKYKSAFVSCAMVGLLLHYPFFGIHWRAIAILLLIPGLAFSFASGLKYCINFFRQASLIS